MTTGQAVTIDMSYQEDAIKDLDKQMCEIKKKHDEIRSSLLSDSVVSFECVTLRKKMDELADQMAQLRNIRERAIDTLEKNLMESKDIKQISEPEQIGLCPGGCTDMIIDKRTNMIICRKCGYVLSFDLNGIPDDSYYKNMPQRKRNGGYRPPVHFMEVIVNLTATRQTTTRDFDYILQRLEYLCNKYQIPRRQRSPTIMKKFLKILQAEENDIIKSLSKKKMTDAEAIKEYSKSKRKIGRYVRYTDYYKQCPEFSKRLSDIGPPIITGTQIDRIVATFPDCVYAYKTSPRYLRKLKEREEERKEERKVRKKDFPNNQSCYYLLYKICQLLDYTEFLPYIPLPKSIENIDDNDINGWKHICESYNWPYIPTR